MGARQAINERLVTAGFEIVRFGLFTIPEELLMLIYPDLARQGGPVWEATLDHLAGKRSQGWWVKGEYAFLKVLAMCGEHTDPNRCAPTTIRAMYGVHHPHGLPGGFKYYLNAVHRPKNASEARRDLNFITPFLQFRAR